MVIFTGILSLTPPVAAGAISVLFQLFVDGAAVVSALRVAAITSAVGAFSGDGDTCAFAIRVVGLAAGVHTFRVHTQRTSATGTGTWNAAVGGSGTRELVAYELF